MNRTRVKICGITRPDDAIAAVEAGADAIGLVFWPGSKRVVNAKTARAIRTLIPPSVGVVGVFVDADTDMVRSIAEDVGISAAQLCGTLEGDRWDTLRLSLRLLRAVGVLDHENINDSLKMNGVNDYLVDNGSFGRHGGTGEPFDWRLAHALRSWGRIWLAGGLNAENVGDAIRAVRPHAVDVSTGVESAPGIKSPELIRALIAAVHHADHALVRGEKHAG